MIQDIAPHQFNNQYRPYVPVSNDYLLCFRERKVLVRMEGEEIRFPRFAESGDKKEWEDPSPIYLFSIDDKRFYTVLDLNKKFSEEYHWEDISLFRTAQPQHLAFAGITGYSLWNWYCNHRFCGRCSAPMIHHERERMMHCPACAQTEYPKISPAVIVGVIHNDKILLTKYANRPYTNYALLAGFAEVGESIEQTIHREVMEEVGLKVKNLRYYKSQPWAFTDCLLLGYFAELDGDDTITLDKEELAIAEWVDRDDMPPAEIHISLTSEMMEGFRTDSIRVK